MSSESEISFESANDKAEDQDEKESSDDEPLAKKNGKKSASPKKKSAKKTPKKSPKAGNKKDSKRKSRVSFLVPTEKKNDKVEEEYEVENIVGHRLYNGKLMYKIRWKNYEPIHDTWESYESLSCPDLLELYNVKHDVEIPKTILKKGKSGGNKAARKRKSSVSSSGGEEDDDDVPYDEGSEEEYEVDRIIEMRMKKDGSREFLVHWKRWSSDYDTWEPENNLSCPDLIEKFLKKVEDAKNSNAKELRQNRKHTQRFTLATHDSGRRLSRRNNKKQRVTYYGEERSDED